MYPGAAMVDLLGQDIYAKTAGTGLPSSDCRPQHCVTDCSTAIIDHSTMLIYIHTRARTHTHAHAHTCAHTHTHLHHMADRSTI